MEDAQLDRRKSVEMFQISETSSQIFVILTNQYLNTARNTS